MTRASPPKIWWSNGIFFVAVHVGAFIGMYCKPYYAVPWPTLVSAVALWQLADFGITIGYHRLYSHRSFRACLAVRLVLAALGSAGFQGSIKWWCLRHRLHHRFTDDPVHDPYAATRGLFYSHMGWIFFKPTYERMASIDCEDLDSDPVVRFQHKHYIPLAVFFGLVVPPLLGYLWGDPIGAFVWGGLVSRIAIWHCTFLVNSLAHWEGLQPYSDEDTSRGTLILALLTGGEGNHNFHAFPHDFRSGPSKFDWDPSKWMILALHRLGLVQHLRRAREDDVKEASSYMHHITQYGVPPGCETTSAWEGEVWDLEKVEEYTRKKAGRCVVIVHGFVVDVTAYLKEHPGGVKILRSYSIKGGGRDKTGKWQDATWAFDGGLNNHSRAAKRRMQELRVAKFIELVPVDEMFIAIVGTRFSGRTSVLDYLVSLKGFTPVRLLDTELESVHDGPLRAESETIPPEIGEAASSRSSPLPEGELIELSNEVNGKAARHISFLSMGSPNFTSSHPTSEFLWGKARQQPLCFPTPSQLLDHVTRNWRSNFVTSDLNTRELIEYFIKRPFFMLVSVDAPLLERFRRSKIFGLTSLEDFVLEHDNILYGTQLTDSTTFGSKQLSSLHSISDLVNVHIVNTFSSLPGLRKHLDALDLLSPDRLRPGWDTYFMTLASLASRRSNCMKRRVGAILVRKNRIVATGYNGTPLGLPNCNEGGCIRCNSDGPSECVCLHAEENALLEAGRDRSSGAVLFCNTCPCLRCTVKIIQAGVEEVVYNLSYKVDDDSAKLFKQAGVGLRRHDPNKHLNLSADDFLLQDELA